MVETNYNIHLQLQCINIHSHNSTNKILQFYKVKSKMLHVSGIGQAVKKNCFVLLHSWKNEQTKYHSHKIKIIKTKLVNKRKVQKYKIKQEKK